MSYARGFGQNGTKLYANITKIQEIELNFTVDKTNGNGLGIRSLKSNGYVSNVFMNTTASFTGTLNSTVNVTGISGGTSSLAVGMPVQGTNIPVGTTIASIVSSSAITLSVAATGSATETITYQGVGRDNFVNPNPAVGYIMIQFKNNFNYALSGSNTIVSPIANASTVITSGLTSGQVYVITSLGTTTQATWNKLGLPLGYTAAVGQTFTVPPGITGVSSGGTGTVGTPGFSGIQSFETCGDPNQLINNSNIASYGGAWVTLQAVSGGALATPAQNTVIALRFRFDGSSVSIPDGLPFNSTTTGGL